MSRMWLLVAILGALAAWAPTAADAPSRIRGETVTTYLHALPLKQQPIVVNPSKLAGDYVAVFLGYTYRLVLGVVHLVSLAVLALEVLFIFPPLAALTLAGMVGAPWAADGVPADRWRPALAGVALQLVFPAAILLCGVLLAHDTALHVAAPRWPEWLVEGLFWAQVAVAIALLVLLRGARWFILAVSVGILGYSCSAAAVSSMSVSGRWL